MDDFLRVLKALADGSRLRIIDLLLSHDLCVGALASCLDISKAAVSQHLQILRKAGLVKGEKRGYWTNYTVQRSVLHEIAGNLMDAADKKVADHAPCQRLSPGRRDIVECGDMNICKDCGQHPERLGGPSEERRSSDIETPHRREKRHPSESKGQKD